MTRESTATVLSCGVLEGIGHAREGSKEAVTRRREAGGSSAVSTTHAPSSNTAASPDHLPIQFLTKRPVQCSREFRAAFRCFHLSLTHPWANDATPWSSITSLPLSQQLHPHHVHLSTIVSASIQTPPTHPRFSARATCTEVPVLSGASSMSPPAAAAYAWRL
ncbi:hypothetical protein GALMADRAFT_136394 [Galerina marginata CBS 339.88]|uniref:Uncharacterized protein n=1 Tax=Galerina marginata (strain CBS 339.88) TaxID=685588 RepID=A0A067TBR2_GALM3|nr:hypothetical protein GALMADRAFT_136394 [Galerina marginata CBS 339.88]